MAGEMAGLLRWYDQCATISKISVALRSERCRRADRLACQHDTHAFFGCKLGNGTREPAACVNSFLWNNWCLFIRQVLNVPVVFDIGLRAGRLRRDSAACGVGGSVRKLMWSGRHDRRSRITDPGF
eukprot:1194383-Prorocentrum_minimum.AAC.2